MCVPREVSWSDSGRSRRGYHPGASAYAAVYTTWRVHSILGVLSAFLACYGPCGASDVHGNEDSQEIATFRGYYGDITPLQKLILPLGPCKLSLWEPCGNKDVVFHLYTSKNGGEYYRRRQLFYPVTKAEIDSSGFDPSLPTKIIIHGYGGGYAEDFIVLTLRDAYIQFGGDLNIINMDWGNLSRAPCYPGAVINTLQGGHCLAQFVENLANTTGIETSSVHAIGLSLGAHLAAFASNDLTNGRKLGRITGLDPALPFFASLRRSWKLDASDADFVDVIHTNSGVFGKIEATGHVDFYVNGGRTQPACATANNIQLCSHVLSTYYFAESVDKKSPGFYGLSCPSYFLYVVGFCTPSAELYTMMGEYCPKSARGIFIVPTAENPPFALGKPKALLAGRRRKSKKLSKGAKQGSSSTSRAGASKKKPA
ncbi:pancreatic lipase-related protein 2-like [Ischnura elegans]|uniref:pancreatic lipase-related protein 2-like n=1 Tax=Ischnura elegans TaxID=197161 RepID=UPI001ED878F9|nr:pancreatic lipase-related protein 2-like [Ischnura elegans]